MPDIEVNGARLYYEVMGEGEETIVFSHSYLADHSHFRPQMEALSKHYRCIAFDHRGHGKSSAPSHGYDMENIYADAVAFIEAMDCAPCHFVGLSTGGFVGQRLAFRRPELLRSLVLMDTSADAEPTAARLKYEAMFLVYRLAGFEVLAGRVMPIFFASKFLDDPGRRDEVAHWRALLGSNEAHAVIAFGRGIFARAPVLEHLGKVSTPTLVVTGACDVAVPPSRAERIAQAIPGAKLVTIPEAGHLCTIEEPAAVNEALTDFFRQIGAAPATALRA